MEIDSKNVIVRLINQYQNLIFSICLKLTGDYFVAEDLTQETFIAAYQHYDQFDGGSEKAWLCRIASNKCIDYQRAAARRMIPTDEDEMPVQGSTHDNEPLQMAMAGAVMEELERCIRLLEPPYDEVAKLHFVKGMNAKEIAGLQNENLKTVQTRIYRAREKLRILYRKEMLT